MAAPDARCKRNVKTANVLLSCRSGRIQCGSLPVAAQNLWRPVADRADEQFGAEMLEKFLHTLERPVVRPRAICFYTERVKMVARDSHGLLGLKLLGGLGVRLVACQTCLEHYGLLDEVSVGQVGGMPEIVSLMARAEKVITV